MSRLIFAPALLLLSGTIAAEAQLAGTWEGTYTCAGRPRPFELEIAPIDNAPDRYQGVFTFFSPEDGSYRVTVDGQGQGAVAIQPSDWLRAPPPGYRPLHMAGRLAGDAQGIEGTLTGGPLGHGNCSVFVAERTGEFTPVEAPEDDLAVPSFLQETDPREAMADACLEVDVDDPVAVYDCLARADNLERFRSTDECRKIYGAYRGMVRAAYQHRQMENMPRGYIKGPETADAPLPNCEVAAEVLYEISGEEPYWKPCLGYDPATKKEHFRDCVMAYFQGRERRDEASAMQRFQSVGCYELKRFYYEFAMPAAYKEREWPDGQIRRLPEDIEDIDCLEIATIEF